jgi:integrase/recombinase XerD
LENYRKEYIVFLELEKGLSANTVSNYLRDLDKLIEYCTLNEQDITKIELGDLEKFCILQSEKGLRPKSMARLVSSIKSYYNFLMIEDIVEESPSDLLQSPKLDKRLPDTISVEEINSLVNTIDLSKSPGFRNKVMLELLYGAGLRVSELTALKINNVNLEEDYLIVVGKGNKERLIPLAKQTKDIVKSYLIDRKKIESKPGYEDLLFLNKSGRSISRVMVFLIVKEAAEKAGIHKNISPHTFRHSFASHLVEGGANLRAVQEMLGHESLLSTEIYTHVNDDYLRSTLIEFHPWSKRA